MNKKKIIETYQEVAMATGLRYDEANNLFHGARDGFDFIAYPYDESRPFAIVLHTAAKSADGSVLDKKAIKAFQKSSKSRRQIEQLLKGKGVSKEDITSAASFLL